MFTHNYRNRFDVNHLQQNVIMTQIRAEKKIHNQKSNVDHLNLTIAPQSQRSGKRVYQEILQRPSLSPSAKENRASNRANNNFNCFGKKIMQETMDLPIERSRSGRRKAPVNTVRPEERGPGQQQSRSGRKRLDCSPNHQHFRTTINLKWS